MTYRITTVTGRGNEVAYGLASFCDAGTVQNSVRRFDGEHDIVFVAGLPRAAAEFIDGILDEDTDVLTYGEVD